jgi:hypothetical protein
MADEIKRNKEMLKLVFFVPDSHVELVKQAVFTAGAGKQGNYDHCSWQVLGQGQFRALKGANPFLGDVGKLETVPEWRVEVIVEEAQLDAVLQAMKAAHPYEHPAYDVIQLIGSS